MNEWPEVALGDHADFLTGFPFKSGSYIDQGAASIRLLRGDNVAQGTLRWDGVKCWRSAERGQFSKYELAKGDVILAMDRPWIAAGLKYGYVRAADLPALLVQRVARLRGSATLDTTFLRYVIGSNAFTDHVQGITTGTAVPHISGGDIQKFRFKLPSLAEQRQIAGILSAYDDLIEVNRRRITVLESMARGLFEEWFLRFRFPGHELVENGESADRPLPLGWVFQNADGLISFDPSTRLPRDGVKPFLSMAELDTTTSLTGEFAERSGNSGSKFRNGDTLFARITPCLENGKTGLVRDLPPEQPVGFGSTEFIVMRERRAGHAFVYCLARHERFRRFAEQGMYGASGRQRVATDKLRGFRLAAPADDDLLHRFEAVSGPMLNLVGHLGAANRKLGAARDILLPRLLSGRLTLRAAERELAEAA